MPLISWRSAGVVEPVDAAGPGIGSACGQARSGWVGVLVASWAGGGLAEHAVAAAAAAGPSARGRWAGWRAPRACQLVPGAADEAVPGVGGSATRGVWHLHVHVPARHRRRWAKPADQRRGAQRHHQHLPVGPAVVAWRRATAAAGGQRMRGQFTDHQHRQPAVRAARARSAAAHGCRRRCRCCRRAAPSRRSQPISTNCNVASATPWPWRRTVSRITLPGGGWPWLQQAQRRAGAHVVQRDELGCVAARTRAAAIAPGRR
jgi:hypothetical protein